MNFKTFLLLEQDITLKQIKMLDAYLDKLWYPVGVEVTLQQHFKDRVNDDRNNPEIKMAELLKLFQTQYKQNGKKIAQLKPEQEAILKDLNTDINIPFIMHWNKETGLLDLTPKTVMRKKDYFTRDKKFITK